jgi:V/A-type H+-transporting ATPase subunit C
MLSRMLSKASITDLSKAESTSTIIGSLLQTEYRKHLDHFGGEAIKENMVDFALNRSFEASVSKLIAISPRKLRPLIESIVSRRDYQNIKLVLRAKALNKQFDSIAKYMTFSGALDEQAAKSALDEQGVEGAARRLMKIGDYRKALEDALAEYGKTGKLTDLESSLDKSMLVRLGASVKKISKISKEGSALISMEIEMRNVLTLMRAKRAAMSVDELKDYLFDNGLTKLQNLVAMYESAKSPADIARSAHRFALGGMAEKSGETDILPYEIAMKRSILEKARLTLMKSVLSLAVIIAYYYMKELEISSLRSIINGKAYSLSSEEIGRMIV